MLHFADGMRAGDGTGILDCHELQESLHDDHVQSMLLSMWDADALEPRIDEPIAKPDRRTKNRLSAQQTRIADREYVNVMLAELERLTETFEMYAVYITQLEVHAADAGDCMVRLGQMHAQNKSKIAMLQESYVPDVPTLMGMPTKERNRIHARTSRQRKHQFVQDLIKQRDESWSTVQGVMQHTAGLESACSVLYDFDDAGCVFLELTETRQTLLMRTDAHKTKSEEWQSRSSYRAMQREKF